MKLLFKALLLRRARDEGFTLPMVIALGLVMILLGAVNIVRSNEENLTAITQNSRTDALAIAELGMTRYRELLDKNRVLTIYSLDQWDDDDADANDNVEAQACDVISNTGGGWADSASAAWRNIILDETAIGTDVNGDGDTTDTSEPIGSYKVVGYTYNGNSPFNQTQDSSNGNSTGTLRVKGRATDGSEAQIQAEIPIRINASDMTNLAPALWIGSGTLTTASMGNLTIPNTANIVLAQAGTGCPNPTGINNVADPTPNNIIADPRNVPPITNIVDLIAAATTGVTKNSITSTALSSGTPLLGQTGDKKNGDGRYYYEVNNASSLDISANTDIQTDGTAEATLYVDNNVTIDNGVQINSSSISSAYLEIYVNGNRTITINTGATPINITAFIHAPNSTLNITGNGTVNINGSVWVNSWSNSTATVNITPDDTYDLLSGTSDKSYKFYTTTQQRTPKPLTSNPSDWKTQEVN